MNEPHQVVAVMPPEPDPEAFSYEDAINQPASVAYQSSFVIGLEGEDTVYEVTVVSAYHGAVIFDRGDDGCAQTGLARAPHTPWGFALLMGVAVAFARRRRARARSSRRNM